MSVKEIRSVEEYKAIISENKAVVIDFTATWCGPCKTVAPIYKGLSENTANVVFCKVDIDEAQPVALEAGIKVVPTFIFYKDGKRVEGGTLEGVDVKTLTELVKQVAA